MLAVSLFICAFVQSQQKRFTHLTTENGISQSEVYSFLKDTRGFVWFGTVDGLNRYDGYNVEVFNTKRDDPHSLSNNTILTLNEDHLGRIWIGTNDGLNVYNPETELFYQISIKGLKEQFTVWSLLIYNGQLIIGTNNGLWRTNIQTNDLEKIESGIHQIKNIQNSGNIRSIIKCKRGGIWVLSPEKISRIEIQNNNDEAIMKEDFSFDVIQYPVSALEDLTGNIWIVFSKDGLIRYNPESKHYRHFNEYGTKYGVASRKCSSLAMDKTGNLWVGTLDKGLNFINKEDLIKEKIIFETIERKAYYSQTLNSNLIRSLYVSEDNLLWIGTIGSGVNIYNPNQKRFFDYKFRDLTSEAPNSNFIRSLNVDNQNRIWTGTHNNGLFLFDLKNDKFQKMGFETQSIFYISNYKENKKLICTNTGIYVVEVVNNKLEILDNSNADAGNDAVFYVVNSKANIYWIAALNGLLRAKIVNDKIIPDKIYTTTTNPGISNNNCRVLLYDDIENKILLGTEGGGLNVISLDNDHYPIKIEVYKNTNDAGSLSNNYVRSIIKDQHQNFWIGTYEGLNNMIHNESTGKISFRSFTKENGLPNNMIQSLIEDNYNSLWIGTNGGLSQYFPEENKFVNFTAIDGIQSNEFSEHCAYIKPDGEILMGGIDGLTMFFPEQIKISAQQPQTTITDFYLFNEKVNPRKKTGKREPLQKSIVLTDSIILLPKQDNIGFDFSAMIYPSAEKVQYAYMLKGFDESWHYSDGGQRNVNYTNLSHGDYTFMVKSTNNDGAWENTPRKIFIHIDTPFYLTWIAFIMYGILILLVFVYFSYYSVIRYTTKKRLLLEKVHNQKIHELDELRTRFFINISHDLRTPLTLISGPLESIMKNEDLSKKGKNKLTLVKRNVKRLNYLVEQLLDVRKAESGKLFAKLSFKDIIAFTREEVEHFNYAIRKKRLELIIMSSPEKIITCFDSSMISKVLFNIISNAIKFTDKGTIKINVIKTTKENREILKNAKQNTFIEVEISDTGKGIEDEQKEKIFNRFYQHPNNLGKGYGIGLSHTKELIDAHGGFIEVESILDVGTAIRFYLPDINKVDESEGAEEFSTEDIYINEEPDFETEVDKKNNFTKTIMVVEDNADMLSYLKSELNSNYNVIEASDGLEGLKKAESIIPDLIVSDVMMPNLDGIEFCKRIKSNIKTSHIPIILLTAKVDTQTKYQGIETGADDYIPKPVEMEYLKIRIKNLLQSREQLRRLFQKNPVLEPSKVTVTSLDEKFLNTLMKAINAGIPDSEFTVNSLESEMGMSHTNLYRKVKSLTGQSGNELLQNMRMKRAYQILAETKGIRVDEVAYMVGFNSPKYFSRCFKEMYGMLPSAIKKNNHS